MHEASAAARARRRAGVLDLADAQAGVLHCGQLYARGWTPAQVRAELAGGRWRRTGTQTVATYTGPLSQPSMWWRAVLEVGPTAVLAGSTALQANGLQGITDDSLHVAAPKSSRPRRVSGVVVHETRRLRDEDVVATGLPRMRTAPAAVLAALWAVSDRQAALYLVAPVQQRMTTAAEVVASVSRITRHRRRQLLVAVAHDLACGAESLGELDFARLCRAAGLPEPSRQRIVRTPRGRFYLDVAWDDWRLAVEIDGAAHMEVSAWLADSWRQNEVVLSGRVVLRFPLVAVRLDPSRVVEQTRSALIRQGWRPQP